MKKSGLGIGLEALFGLSAENNEKPLDEALKDDVTEVPLADIIVNVNQPRKVFDEDALRELAISVKNYGIIQPILVCRVGKKYQIVAGERRYRAAKLAELKTVPVIVKDFTPQQRKEIALIENVQRQDLNAIEEARAYQALIEEYGFKQEELADKLGKSRPVVTNALRLLTLCPAVLDMVSAGRLSAGHARALVSVKDPALQEQYALAACDKQMSVRQLETMVYNHNHPKTVKKTKPTLTPELKDLVHEMQYVFGTKVKGMGNNTRGRIYIDYFSDEDLDRIYSLIKTIHKNELR